MHEFGTLTLFLKSHPLWIAAVVSIMFALLARRLRGVTLSGATAGAVICFIYYAGAGAGAFVVLVALFGLTWLATRVGYRKKVSLGTAENREGRRASQVLANLGAAACCVIGFQLTGHNPVLMIAFAAAIAEAAADTISSEIGQSRSDNPRLLTTLEIVPAGTDGGISLMGTMAGLAAAVTVCAISAAVGIFPWPRLGVPITAAVAGMFADSLLGASLERRGWINNDAVNFLSTCMAVAVVLLLS
jgi:uncharacterized protein (TIGR00297 family)